jgi:TRAP-type C4-dicarboxylate transport system substrate-binding protein
MIVRNRSVPPPTPWRALATRAVALVAGLALALAAEAQVVIKLGTIAPEGSVWGDALQRVAQAWKEASAGKVELRIFAGGVLGGEDELVRKLQRRVIDGVTLSGSGLPTLERSFNCLNIPLLFESSDELDYVRDRVAPEIEKRLEAKGFVVLNWADAGWVHFFTQKPVAVPDDLRKLKLFSWAGDAEAVEVWRSAGFNPVPLPSTEIATALQTGLVEALGSPPQVAVISQFFNHAKYMTDFRWQLLQGATIITKATWEKIPADLRPEFLRISQVAGTRLQKEIRDSEAKDVEAMKKRGLTVVPVSPAQKAQWQKLTESIYPRIRGKVVPAEAFDEAMRYRDEYRKQRGAAAGK